MKSVSFADDPIICTEEPDITGHEAVQEFLMESRPWLQVELGFVSYYILFIIVYRCSKKNEKGKRSHNFIIILFETV